MGMTIRIRHVPEEIHRTIESRAALAGLSISDYLLREIQAIVTRPTAEELRARLADRDPVRTSESMADAVRAVRDGR